MITAQNTISGMLNDDTDNPILFANVVLNDSETNKMVKVESTDENGAFTFKGINNGDYYMVISYIGYEEYRSELITLNQEDKNMGTITMSTGSVQLETAVVKAKRAIVEVKPDRTVFNVEGTVNAVGDNALGLLRKAPGVLVDNNNNISVLSRSGVLIYVDGKRLPLSGDDLKAYLENLPAEQIDRMDIITNPGAKYEAQGNAGIIDIRLKRNKNHGANGSISGTLTQGRYTRGNVSSTGNYRNERLNTFGTLGYGQGESFNEIYFLNQQNGLRMEEDNFSKNGFDNINYRWGTDFYFGKNHTLGFLIGGQNGTGNNQSENRIEIGQWTNPVVVDSILVANNSSESDRQQRTYNLNYVFDNKKHTLNVDLDYGMYDNNQFYDQPNLYYNPQETEIISQVLTQYDTPVDIKIATAKVDYETDALGGKWGFGSKVSNVETDNTFLFYDIVAGERVQNNRRSNRFKYDENVYAVYGNYARQLNQKWNMSAGLRVETTDAQGHLEAFLPELEEDPVDLEYTNLFPSAGLTYAFKPNHVFALNYGRRINRPDYNVLNPFRVQLSEISFSKGNEKLNPEIVNNLELGYTLNYRYNFKLSYSVTTDQITRLIAPAEEDPRANFITWDNLAQQTIYNFNASAPFPVTSWWNAYVNFSAGYLDNQADYGDGAVVDVQTFTYSAYQQQTFTLPKGFVAEVSGYFSGPGVWGGVFRYDSNYSLNLGLQKKFFNDNMNVRLTVNDIFYQTGWSGTSEFDGLIGEGRGNWDSRRAALSISYLFGNQNVKSRKRKTGIEAEQSRISKE